MSIKLSKNRYYTLFIRKKVKNIRKKQKLISEKLLTADNKESADYISAILNYLISTLTEFPTACSFTDYSGILRDNPLDPSLHTYRFLAKNYANKISCLSRVMTFTYSYLIGSDEEKQTLLDNKDKLTNINTYRTKEKPYADMPVCTYVPSTYIKVGRAINQLLNTLKGFH